MNVPNLGPIDTSTLALGGMLAAIVTVTLVAALVSSYHRRRRDSASLGAIDFVRTSFASRLAHGEPLEELMLQLAEALRDTFRLDNAEVWLESGGALELKAAEPPRQAPNIPLTSAEQSIVANAQVSGAAWARVWLPVLLDHRPEASLRVAPIAHSGQLLGLFLVERRRQPEKLAEETDQILQELSREVGIAVNKARLDTALRVSLEQVRKQALDLQASRARIVSAADAERRRIERNLHDGAQQHLVALAVRIRLIQQLAEKDPQGAMAIVGGLDSDLQTAIDELRVLAHGIYPPLLSSGGLSAALAAACRRAAAPAELEVDRLGRYPAELESAVYFCCVEALQNIAKYAGEGAAAAVRVWEESGALRFEVTDAGAGFDSASAGLGSGLTGMADRVGAVDGVLRVESSPGCGTTVRGSIPIPIGADPARQDAEMSARPSD